MAQAKLSPVQVERITLERVQFERTNPEPEGSAEGFRYALDIDIEVKRAKSNNREGLVQLALEVHWESSPGPFALSLSYDAHVVHDGTLEDEVFESICRVRVPAMILGFARPFVARLMSEAEESFRLPLVDLRQHLEEPPETATEPSNED